MTGPTLYLKHQSREQANMKQLKSIFAQVPEKPEEWSKLKTDEKKKIIETLNKDLSTLFKEIAAEFSHEFTKKVTATSDELLDVVTYLLPQNYPDLKKKMEALQNDAPYSGEPGFAFTTIYSAIINKEHISKNESPTSESLKTQLMLEEESSASSDNRKQISSKIKTLISAEKVANKLLRTTLPTKLDRIQVDHLSFEVFIHDAPPFIKKYPIGDQSLEEVLDEMRDSFRQLVEDIHTDPNEENLVDHERNIGKFQSIHSKLLLGLFKSLEVRTEAVSKTLTPGSHNELINRMEMLKSFLPTLMISYDEKNVYQELVNKFMADLSTLVTEISTLYESREEVMHRLKTALSDKEAEIQFPKHEYPFLLNPGELRKSANIFLQDQIKLSQSYTELPDHDDKFILTGKFKDNLFQIERDAERNLLLQGQEVKHLKGEALHQHLKTTFGSRDAINLIHHYDQGLSLMISGAVSSGASTANLMDQVVMLKQAENFTQNIFSVDGVVYRDAALKHLNLVVQEDEDAPIWTFKVNLKALSWTTKDGFTLQFMGTDSPLICATLMQKSNYENLEKIVTLVLKYEKEFKLINDETAAAKQEKQLVNAATILGAITDFKTGRITFDELAGTAVAFSNQAEEIIRSRGKMGAIFSAFKKDANDILPKLLDFGKAISELKNNMDQKAAPHRKSVAEQATSSKLTI